MMASFMVDPTQAVLN